MDQPTPVSRELLEKGVVKAMLAQKPGEMAYLAMLFGMAYLDGATDLPKQVLTSWTVFTPEDLKDSEKAKLFEEQ